MIRGALVLAMKVTQIPLQSEVPHTADPPLSEGRGVHADEKGKMEEFGQGPQVCQVGDQEASIKDLPL